MTTIQEPSLSKQKEECLKSIRSGCKYIVFDFETTSLTPRTGEVKGVAITTRDGDFWLPGEEAKDVLDEAGKNKQNWVLKLNQENIQKIVL